MKSRRLYLFLNLCVIAPIVVAVVMMILGERWFPAGDMAQAELHMRGFFERPPLVGAAGRIVSDSGFQGSHPGPSLWVAMLPVYLLGGRSSDALMAAAASVHVISIAAIIYLARRRFGWTFASLLAVMLLAVVRSSGTDFMIEPWNPWLALLPFAVFVLLVMEVISPSVMNGENQPRMCVRSDLKFLILAIIVGSHCVQSHAGYALLVVPPIGVMLVLVTIRHSRDRKQRSIRTIPGVFTPVLVGVGTAVVMWSPAFIDQIRRRPGNLSILWQHFGSPEEPTLGLMRSIEIVASQLNLFGPWLFGPGAANGGFVRWVGFIAFVAIVVAAFKTSNKTVLDSNHRSVLLVLVGFLFLGSISILRIFGPYYEYTVRWFWLLASMTISFCVFVLWKSSKLSIRFSSSSALCGSYLLKTFLVALSTLSVLQVIDRVKLPGRTDSRILAGLIDDVSLRIDKDKTYQIRFFDPYTLNATGFGLTLELERRGFDVRVDPEFAAAALPHRTAPMNETDEVLWVVVGPALEEALEDPALSVLATFNPRSPQQQERSVELLKEVERGLRDAGRDDLVASLDSPGASILFTEPPLPEKTTVLVRELIGMGQPTGVFSMAVDDVARSLR
jgi:hypothetical protein